MKEGFDERFREFLASEELEEKIESFMTRNAKKVLKHCDIGESKGHEGEFEGGEFSHEAYGIYEKYVLIMEDSLVTFQESEGLDNREFKAAVEKVAKIHPFLVKMMLCSWEFGQFLDICKEYYESNDYDSGAESKNESKDWEEKDEK